MKKTKSSSISEKSEFVISKTNLIAALILAAISFLLYANTIRHEYVLDDFGVIVENEFVQQGFKGLGNIFTSQVWHFQNAQIGYYRPLSLATFAIENQFFPNNSHVSHFNNVLLYSFTAFVLFLLLVRVFKNFSPLFSFLVTLLFIAHPVHSEVVANIKSRDEILSFLNLILSALTFFGASKNEKTNFKWLVVSFVFFYFALLSKESAVIGVLFIPLILFFDGKPSLVEIAKCTAPFVVLIFVFQLQKYLALGSASGMIGTDIINYPYLESGSKIASVFLIYAWCVKLLFVPHLLCYSYAFNQIPAVEWSSFGAIIGLLIAIFLLVILYRNFKSKIPLSFALIFFFITILPVLGFVFLRGGIFAERFLYAPVLGFSIAIVWLLWKITQTNLSVSERHFSKARNVIAIVALIFLLYSFKTITRNNDWRDNFSLVSHDVLIAENNCQVHFHYGMKLSESAIREKNLVEKNRLVSSALEQFNSALKIYPHFTEAYFQIGQMYHKAAQNFDSAVFYYNKAIMENANYALSYFGLAELYESTNKQELASYYYNKVVEMNPVSKQAVFARNQHKQKTGLDVKNFPSENIATDSTEKDFSYYLEQGKAFGQRGDFETGIRYLEKAMSINPNSEEVLINLSVCLGMTRNYSRSIEVLERVLAINPNNTTALTNISILHNHIGNKEKGEVYRNKLEALQKK